MIKKLLERIFGFMFTKRVRKIKLVATDIDGVLTDGRLLYLDGRLCRSFNIKDGVAFSLLKLAGIKIAVMSGKSCEETKKRFRGLGVDYYCDGVNDKLAALKEIISEAGIEWDEVCYIGDDIPDLPVMKKVGFSVAPSDACNDAKSIAEYVCEKNGGKGALREVAEVLLTEKGIWKEILQKFLSSQ